MSFCFPLSSCLCLLLSLSFSLRDQKRVEYWQCSDSWKNSDSGKAYFSRQGQILSASVSPMRIHECVQRLGKQELDDRNCWGTVEKGLETCKEQSGLIHKHTVAGWIQRKARARYQWPIGVQNGKGSGTQDREWVVGMGPGYHTKEESGHCTHNGCRTRDRVSDVYNKNNAWTFEEGPGSIYLNSIIYSNF